jgi:cell wall-associated NlpC family hydrolase
MKCERIFRIGAAAVIALVMVGAVGRPVGAESGDTAVVAYTDGEGLNLRNAPSLDSEIIAGMPEGAMVEVIANGFFDDSGTEWSQITFDGIEGYGAAQYLETQPTDAAAPIAINTSSPAPDATTPATTATVLGTNGDGLNVRDAPSLDANVITGVLEGAIVQIVDGPVRSDIGDPWYQVIADGVTGWVHGAYLVENTPAAVGAQEIESVSTDVGDAIVAEAMLYLGTPYVWAGTTPDGFDCSGFTYYVINQVLGNDFPRAIDEQIISGQYVAPDDLQAGDLVFLENTYQPGLSHIGIYIANGEFVSAVSEDEGVAIRNLWDDYWGQRYVTARRIR